jgi:hypothetical protein
MVTLRAAAATLVWCADGGGNYGVANRLTAGTVPIRCGSPYLNVVGMDTTPQT